MIFGKWYTQTFRSTGSRKGHVLLPCFIRVKDAYRAIRCLYVCVLRCSLHAFIFRYLIPKSLELALRRHQSAHPAVSTVKVCKTFETFQVSFKLDSFNNQFTWRPTCISMHMGICILICTCTGCALRTHNYSYQVWTHKQVRKLKFQLHSRNDQVFYIVFVS
jgi:hypothetical protein